MANNNYNNNNYNNIKEENTMKNVMIIVNPEMMTTVIEEHKKAGIDPQSGVIVTTFGHKEVPIVRILRGNPQESGLDLQCEPNGKVYTKETYRALKAWYEKKINTVSDEVFRMLEDKYIFCYSYQAAALETRFLCAGVPVNYEAMSDGKTPLTGDNYFEQFHAKKVVEAPAQPQKPAAPVVQNNGYFTVSNDIEELGAGRYVFANGTVKDEYRKGKQMSVIVMQHKHVKFDVDSSWFEAHGMFVVNDDIKKIVHAAVNADDRETAQEYLDKWAVSVCGEGATFSTDWKRISKGLIAWASLKKNETPLWKSQITEAARIQRGKFVYVEEPPTVSEDVMAVIAALQQRVEKLEEANQKLQKKVAGQQKLIDDLVAARAAAAHFEKKNDDSTPIVEDLGNITLDEIDTNVSAREGLPETVKQQDNSNDTPAPAAGDSVVEDLGDITLDDIDTDISAKDGLPDISEKEEDSETPIVVDDTMVKTVAEFVTLDSVKRTNFFSDDEYETAVAKRDSKVRAAVTAANVLGVDITKMKVLIRRLLRGTGNSILSDIKAENFTVFVKVSCKESWRQVIVNSKGLLEFVVG